MNTSCVGRSDTGADPAAASRIVVTPDVIPADGNTRARVDIYILDGDGAPRRGVEVTLVARGDLSIEQPTQRTDASGHTMASVYGMSPGAASLQLKLSLPSAAITPAATSRVTLLPAGGSVGNHIEIAISPISGSVDNASGRQVHAKVISSLGTPVPGVAMTLTTARPGDIVVPSQGTTGPAGDLIAQLISTAAGVASVNAASPGVANASASTLFEPGVPEASHIYLLTQLGGAAAADGVTVTAADVFIGDQYGNPVPLATVTVTSPGSGVGLVPPRGQADANGIFHTTVTASQVGTASVAIDAGSGATYHDVQLVSGPVNAAASSITLSPNAVVADGVSSAAVTAFLADALGHPRLKDRVEWASDSGQATFQPSSSVTDANGFARAEVRSRRAGPMQIAANIGNCHLTAPLIWLAGAPNATLSTLALTPSGVAQAGNPLADNLSGYVISGRIADAYGNAVANQNIHLSVQVPRFMGARYSTVVGALTTALAINGVDQIGGEAFPATSTCQDWRLSLGNFVTLVNGNNSITYSSSGNQLLVDNLTLAQRQSEVIFDATAAALSGGAIFDTTVKNYSGSGYAYLPGTTQGTLQLQVPTAMAGGAVFYSLRYIASDSPAQLITSFNAAAYETPTLAKTPSPNTWVNSPYFSAYLAEGNNTFAMTATSGNLLVDQIVIVARASATTLEAETGVLAGAASVSTAYPFYTGSGYVANLLGPNDTLSVTVANTADSLLPADVTSDANGRFTSTWTSTVAEKKELTATFAGAALSMSANFAAGPPVSATSQIFVPVQAALTAGLTSRLGVQLQDVEGNPVPGVTPVLTASQVGDALGSDVAPTDDWGRTSISFRAILAGSHNVCVDAGSACHMCTIFTVQAASANAINSQISLTPNATVAGGSTTLAVSLVDAFGNAVSGQATTLAGVANLLVISSLGVTDSNGLATGVVSSVRAQQTNLQLIAGDTTLATPWTVRPGSANSVSSTLLATSANPVANNSSVASLVGTFVDSFNNPVANEAVQIQMQQSRWISARYSSGAGTNANFTGVAVNGVSSAPWVLVGNANYFDYRLSDHYPVIVSSGNNLITVTHQTSPTSLWDALYVYPSDANWTIQAETGTLYGGATVSTGHQNYTGTGLVDFHNILGASLTITAFGVAGDLNREFSFRYALLGAANAAYRIALNGNFLPVTYLPVTPNWDTWYMSPTTNITLLPGNNTIQFLSANPTINLDFFRLRAIPSGIQSIEAESGSIYGGATLNTNYAGFSGTSCVSMNNTLGAGFAVNFSSSEDTFSPKSAVSDANGQVFVSVVSPRAESKILTLSNTNVSVSQTVTFVGGPPARANSLISLESNIVTAGTSRMVGVVAHDLFDNSSPSATITLTTSDSSIAVAQNTLTVDARGVAYTYVTSTLSQSGQICATYNALFSLCQNLSIVAANPNGANSSLVVTPNTAIAGSSITYAGLFVDSFGNACSNQSLSIVNQGNGVSAFGPFSATLDANGNLLYTTSSSSSANYVATVLPLVGMLGTPFTINPNVMAKLVVNSIRSLPMGLVNDVQVVAADMFNNKISTAYTGTVSFSSSDANATLPGPYTFQVADNSSHLIPGMVQFFSQGTQTITAQDTAMSSFVGAGSAQVRRPLIAPYVAVVAGTSPNICLKPINAQSAPGTLISGFSCRWSHDQIAVLGSDQSFRLLNQCIQPQNGVAVAGQNLVLSACNGSPKQRWAITANAVTSVANPNLCIDPTPASSNGIVVLAPCSSPNTLKLVLTETSRSKDIGFTSTGYQPIFNSAANLTVAIQGAMYPIWHSSEDELIADPNLCMTIQDANFSPNAVIALSTCSGASTQKWLFSQGRITSKAAPTLCLNNNNNLLQAFLCTAAASNFATFAVGYDMQLRPVESLANNLCVQTQTSAALRGQNATLAPCNQSSAQIFSSASTSVRGYSFLVTNLGDPNYPYLSALYTGVSNVNGQPVVTYYKSDNQQTFYTFNDTNITTTSGPGVFYRTQNNPQKYLDISPTTYSGNGSLEQTIKTSMLFVHEPRPVRVQSANNTCLRAQSGNFYYNAPMLWGPCDNSSSQKMFLPYPMGYPMAVTKMMPVTFQGLCLDALMGSGGNSLVMAECSYAASQNWRIGGSGSVAMVNGTNLCLDGTTSASGSFAQLQPCTGASNQNVSFIPF